MARGPALVHELLVYPVAGTGTDTPSYQKTVNAVPLNRAAILWYVLHFTDTPADLHGLPATTIISDEIDPLRSEGEMLGQKLQAAGVSAARHTYPGVTHEFFGMGAVVAQAKLAEEFATSRLKALFSGWRASVVDLQEGQR